MHTLLHRTVQSYTPRPTPITSPDSSKVPPIMISEVKKTLKEMKNNKAPGIDNLTCDVMIPRGEESVTQIIHTKKKMKSDLRDKKDTS